MQGISRLMQALLGAGSTGPSGPMDGRPRGPVFRQKKPRAVKVYSRSVHDSILGAKTLEAAERVYDEASRLADQATPGTKRKWTRAIEARRRAESKAA